MRSSLIEPYRGMKFFIGNSEKDRNWQPVFAEHMASYSFEELTGPDAKAQCDFILYIIDPGMQGISTIIQAVNDSNLHAAKTLFCTLIDAANGEFSAHQKKSLNATGKMIVRNGGQWFTSLDDLVAFVFKPGIQMSVEI